MALDATFLSGGLEEIRAAALGGRVEKLYQPARDTVVLLLRGEAGRVRLLIVANPAAPRLHLTGTNPENPDQPPMFCMLLRTHLLGGRLTAVEQLPMERAAIFTFLCTDEMGDQVEKKLVAELMGRTTNVYLLSPEGRILDCLRRVGLDESAHRQALPGLYYQRPEPVEKLPPRDVSAQALTGLLQGPGADRLSDRLMDGLGGLSPLVCREAALAAAGEADARLEGRDPGALGERLAGFFGTYAVHPRPYLVRVGDRPKAYAFCPVAQYGPGSECVEFPAFSQLLDAYYGEKDKKDLIRQKGQGVRKTVSNLLDRVKRKLAAQEKELEATYGRERLRQLGDIVTANLHSIVRGQLRLTACDFYDPEMKEIDIPLSPTLSPQQNAAKFYKDYTKAKNAQRELTKQRELGRGEQSYLESVLEELDRAGSEQELEEIRQELIAGGYLRPEAGKKRMKQPQAKPMRFESTDGYPIYVGRNNRQNDELTTKLARKDDLWLHAQKLHGCHVVIPCAGVTPPDDTITQAAQLAALYSQGGQGQNVAVDVTPVKFVKKPAGAKPGMVVYYQYRTVYVTPDPGLPERLRAGEKNR